MNAGTLIGLGSGVLILIVAIVTSTGEASIFWHPQGLAIVLGGVGAATFVAYPLHQVRGVLDAFGKALQREDLPLPSYIAELHYLAQQAVSGDPMRLEQELEGMENYFLKDGLRMLVDHYPADKVRTIMETAIAAAHSRELADAEIFRTMAKLAPAFGMVGTLIGLIVMFKNMGSDLSAVGPGMATAMMTTFYGLLFAYLLFLPIAIKLERRCDERARLMTAIMEGLLLVAKRTPPELVLDELKTFLPPARWKDIKVRRHRAGAAQKKS